MTTAKSTAIVYATPPLMSKAGLKERGYALAKKGLELLPAAGGTAGGLIGAGVGSVEPGGGTALGAVAGAGIGGATGKVLEQAGKQALFGDKPPGTLAEEGKTLGWEALKQSLYELSGRILGGGVSRVGSRLFRGPGASAGEEIAGVKIPETVGQMYGKPGGFLQQVEHYTKGTFAGGPLKEIQAVQEDAARQIVNKLSGSSEGLSMSENWARAREATRIMADPMYDSLRTIPSPEGVKIANELLADDALRLSAKAKRLLGKTGGGALFSDLGYRSQKEAEQKLGSEAMRQLIAKDPRLGGGAITVGDLLEVRSELGKLARSTTDAAERSRLWEAVKQVNQVTNKGLNAQQMAVKKEADKLWHRSYIMDDISDELSKMEASQDPLKQKKVAVDAFVKMVNDLAETPLGHRGTEIVKYPSKLDMLFDRPEDRAAMKQLASFLKSRYSRLGGQSGPAESFARIGLIFDAVGSVGYAAAGHPATAAASAAPIAILYSTAKVLSDPGGAVRLLRAISGTPGLVGATTVRTGATAGELLRGLRGKENKPGDQIRDLHKILERHSSNPNLPTGDNEP